MNKAKLALLVIAVTILSCKEPCFNSQSSRADNPIYIERDCDCDIDCITLIETFNAMVDEAIENGNGIKYYADSIKVSYDSLKCYADSIKASNNNLVEISESFKRIVAENAVANNMIESHNFYNKAFSNIQAWVGIFLTFIAVIVAVPVINQYKYDKNISELKREIESQKKYLDSNKYVLFNEIGNTFFSIAIAYFKQQDWVMHFRMLTKYYNFLVTYKMDIQVSMLGELTTLRAYTESFKDVVNGIGFDGSILPDIQKYSNELQRFIEYCDTQSRRKYFEVAQILYDEFQEVIKTVSEKYLSALASQRGIK